MGFVRLSASGLAIAAAVLGGSTSLAEEAAPKKARTCINRREINTVAALDDAHVFAKLSAGRFHLFTVSVRKSAFATWTVNDPASAGDLVRQVQADHLSAPPLPKAHQGRTGRGRSVPG